MSLDSILSAHSEFYNRIAVGVHAWTRNLCTSSQSNGLNPIFLELLVRRRILSYTACVEYQLDRLTEQEHDLLFDHFDQDDAWHPGCAFVEKAQADGLGITIDI